MQTGIYEIVNTVNGKRYVGSAKRFSVRWSEHRRDLSASRHHSSILQKAWVKYGSEAFEFRKLLVCKADDLLFYEQRALDALNPEYNIARTAGSTLGVGLSAQHKSKISEGMLRRIAADPSWHVDVTRKANAATRAIWADPDRRAAAHRRIRETLVPKFSKYYELDGVRLSRQEWAAKLGITPSTLTNRIQKWGVERALRTPATVKHSREALLLRATHSGLGKLYTYQGEELMITELARRLGTSRQAILYYLKRHTYEEMIAHYEAKRV